MRTATISKFGPGTLTIGEVGTPIDISCQIEYASVAWDKSKDDDVQVLCGDVVPGADDPYRQPDGSHLPGHIRPGRDRPTVVGGAQGRDGPVRVRPQHRPTTFNAPAK